jgi:hypothetical protein
MIERVGRMNQRMVCPIVGLKNSPGGIFPCQEAVKESGKGLLRFSCKNEIKPQG